MSRPTYVLVTAANNEERFIGATIESVVAQTLPPREWVIVSDVSRDRTEAIVESCAAKYPYIRLLRITKDHPRNFEAQVNAINLGFAELDSTPYDFIGNLDADVTFAPDYFAGLLARFEGNPRLGLAGGTLREQDGRVHAALRGERLQSVPHAIQLFRRACHEALGQRYRALRYGGPDTYAEILARMKGWEVESFPELMVQHHRITASTGGVLRGRFRQGQMDFSLGYDPAFQVFKCARRLGEPPALLGALLRLAGYFYSGLRGEEHLVPDDFIQFLRTEQRHRLRNFIQGPTHASSRPF